MENHLDRRVSNSNDVERVAANRTRSFRYEDYSTRRVFLRSYPLQWDWTPTSDDEKKNVLSAEDRADGDGDGDRDECCGSRRWKRQVLAAVTEWGEDKLLLLRRAKKRLTLYLIGCNYGRRALPFSSGGASCTVAMLTSSR